MFQFNRFAHLHPFFKWIGFPIRKSADQFIFANPRSLSQLITSFIASESQGIPRVPFLTFFYHYRFCSIRYVFIIDRFSVVGYQLSVLRITTSDFLLLTFYFVTVLTVVSVYSITSSNMSKNFLLLRTKS